MIGYSNRRPGLLAVLCLVFGSVLLGGCRTYGGYGSEEATYQQILQLHQVFEGELERAKSDLRSLESAASENNMLTASAAQYAQLVQGHEAILAEHTDRIEGLSAESEKRDLRRAFGSMLVQRNTIRRQYQGLLTHISEAHAAPDTTQDVERPYALVPPYYERVREEVEGISLNDVLARVRSASASGIQMMSPEVAPAESDTTGSEGGAPEAGPSSDTGAAGGADIGH